MASLRVVNVSNGSAFFSLHGFYRLDNRFTPCLKCLPCLQDRERVMECLQLVDIGKFERRDVPLPEPGKDDVRLAVTACGVCRTDAKMWRSGHRDLILPRVPGHEICGVSETDRRRYVLWPGRACGGCEFCKQGAENLCRAMEILGFHRDGGFAAQVAAPRESLIPIPDDLPAETATLAEPLACCLNALDRLALDPGQSLLVFGAGPVGLMMALAARSRSMRPVVQEIDPARRVSAARFMEGIGGEATDGERLPETNGAVNAAPVTRTVIQGLAALKPGGAFCLFSGLTDDAVLPASALHRIHYRQLRITGAYGCTRRQMREAVDALTRFRESAAAIVESRISLSSAPDIMPAILAGRAMRHVIVFQS